MLTKIKPKNNGETALFHSQAMLKEQGATFGDMKDLNVPRFEFRTLEELMGVSAMIEQQDKNRSRVRSIALGVTTLHSDVIVPFEPQSDAYGNYGTYSLPADINPEAGGETRKFAHAGNDIWKIPAMKAAVEMMKSVSPFRSSWKHCPLEVEATYIGYNVRTGYDAVATPPYPHFDKIDRESISGVFLLLRQNVKGGESFLVKKAYVNTSMEEVPASAVIEARTLTEPGEYLIFHETGEHLAHHVMPIKVANGCESGYRAILTLDIRPTFRG